MDERSSGSILARLRGPARAWGSRVAFGLAAAASGAACPAQVTMSTTWDPHEGRSTTDAATTAELSTRGWACSEFVSLPAPRQSIALCRRSAAGTGELSLVHRAGATAGAPKLREVSRLGDASHAHLRLFAPADPCPGGHARGCLDAVVLVDEWDESSCYGTQVLAADGMGQVRNLGFIDLALVEGAEMRCVGTASTLSGDHRAAVAVLKGGRLARIERNGRTALLADESASYRISVERLTAVPIRGRR